MMDVVIQKSRRKDKKLDAVIDGKKPSLLVRLECRTSRFIRMTTGSRGTSPGTRRMKIGEILKRLDFILNMCYGIKQPYRLQLMIRIKVIKKIHRKEIIWLNIIT